LLRWGLIVIGWYLGAWIGEIILIAVIFGDSVQEIISSPDKLYFYPLISVPYGVVALLIGVFEKRPAYSFVGILLASAMVTFLQEGWLFNTY